MRDWVRENGAEEGKIQWVEEPPGKVKCMPNYTNQTWPEWDAPRETGKVKRGYFEPGEEDGRPMHFRSPGLPR